MEAISVSDEGDDGEEATRTERTHEGWVPESGEGEDCPSDGGDRESVVSFDETGAPSVPSDLPSLESGTPLTDDADESAPSGDRGPLGDLASRANRRERDRGSSDPAVDDLFDREPAPEIDSETLWDTLEADDAPVEGAEPPDGEYRTIPKRTYCHQCEWFSAPPTVACENDGTEILEMPSMDEFRVVDCPVVLEDEVLGGER